MNNYDALIAPEDRIAKVRAKVGGTIQEILLKDSQFDLYEILGALEVLVGSKIYKRLLTSSSERMVFALTWLAREVGTGGFRQFFINSAGDFWKDVLGGLIAIGDQQGLSTFRETLSRVELTVAQTARCIANEYAENHLILWPWRRFLGPFLCCKRSPPLARANFSRNARL